VGASAAHCECGKAFSMAFSDRPPFDIGPQSGTGMKGVSTAERCLASRRGPPRFTRTVDGTAATARISTNCSRA
jgi:hypothetical protein